MFQIQELLKATRGKLIRGPISAKVVGISIDSRTIKPKEAFIALKGPNFDGHDFIQEAIKKGAACIIQTSNPDGLTSLTMALKRSQSAPNSTVLIEVKDTTKALGDIARFQRRKFDIPVVAITGSSGKTTAKEMMAEVLSKNYRVLKSEGTKNNHIGVPLTLLKLSCDYDIVILEMGTNHPKEIEYLARICQPDIGVITNIGPAHLESFKTLKGVFREKYSLVEYLKKPYIAILNADDDSLARLVAKKIKKPFILGFGIKNNADFLASDIKRDSKGGWEFLVNQRYKFTLSALGYYNIYNALAAVALARIFGQDYAKIIEALADFCIPPGRLKFVKLNETTFIDDTYNSNPLSLEQALSTLADLKIKGRKILVMGDMLELGNQAKILHVAAGKRAADICDVLIAVGDLAKFAAESAKKYGLSNQSIFTCETPMQAREILLNKIAPGQDDIVLVKGSRCMKMEEVLKLTN